MAAVNIIFLDVDGVLNVTSDHKHMSSEKFFVREKKVLRLCRIIKATDARVVFSTTWRFYKEMTDYVEKEICRCLATLRYSNLGRVGPDIEQVSPEMYDDVVISSTPDLSEPKYKTKPLQENFHQTRTDEIILWLKENGLVPVELTNSKGCPEHSRKYAKRGDIQASQWLLPRKIKIKNFIAIDDMMLSLFSCYKRKADIQNHFVHTLTDVGLEGRHEKIAIKLLNAEFDFAQWYENVHVPCDRSLCFHKSKAAKPLNPVGSKLTRHNRFSIQMTPARAKTEPSHSLETETKPKKNSTPPREIVDDGYDFVL